MAALPPPLPPPRAVVGALGGRPALHRPACLVTCSTLSLGRPGAARRGASATAQAAGGSKVGAAAQAPAVRLACAPLARSRLAIVRDFELPKPALCCS